MTLYLMPKRSLIVWPTSFTRESLTDESPVMFNGQNIWGLCLTMEKVKPVVNEEGLRSLRNMCTDLNPAELHLPKCVRRIRL
ncbi:hypothetical protein TNCV_4785431 [Trichonephila clavipes]|nr:hypothetical protein TNCV_4785431 [Trichonephila clavipes]